VGEGHHRLSLFSQELLIHLFKKRCFFPKHKNLGCISLALPICLCPFAEISLQINLFRREQSPNFPDFIQSEKIDEPVAVSFHRRQDSKSLQVRVLQRESRLPSHGKNFPVARKWESRLLLLLLLQCRCGLRFCWTLVLQQHEEADKSDAR
jgi:hypothetical protein